MPTYRLARAGDRERERAGETRSSLGDSYGQGRVCGVSQWGQQQHAHTGHPSGGCEDSYHLAQAGQRG
eukprot:10095711-Prorocentrum_lima.AAC.1